MTGAGCQEGDPGTTDQLAPNNTPLNDVEDLDNFISQIFLGLLSNKGGSSNLNDGMR